MHMIGMPMPKGIGSRIRCSKSRCQACRRHALQTTTTGRCTTTSGGGGRKRDLDATSALRFSVVVLPMYDVWVNEPASIQERRQRLLRHLGLTSERTLAQMNSSVGEDGDVHPNGCPGRRFASYNHLLQSRYTMEVWWLCLLLLIPLFLFFLWPSPHKNLPPGPRPWPIIGNMLSIGSQSPHVELMKLASHYGPLMLVKLGAQPMIIASAPDSAMEILRTHDRAMSGRYVGHSLRMKDHTEHSVVWADCTDNWKALRRMARTELFSTRMLDAHTHVREAKVAEMVEYMSRQEGTPVRITEVVFGTLLNILGHAVYSQDVFQYGEKGDKVSLQKLIREMLYIAASPNVADLYPILGGLDLQGLNQACLQRLRNVTALWAGVVKERRAKNDQTKHDFLQVLLENGFTDPQINAIFLETFGPGSETSSTTIEWAMAELLKHPDKMAKAIEELDREVGQGAVLAESHLPRLVYLQTCIKETMRLHPAAPFLLPHRSVEPCQIMGYKIPQDYKVLVNAYAIGRDPGAWSNPNAFLPERFLGSDMDYNGNHFQFIPFGAGRRICMGLPLANKTIPLILGSLLHSFSWALPNHMVPAKLEMKEKLSLTLVLDPSLVVVPKSRK